MTGRFLLPFSHSALSVEAGGGCWIGCRHMALQLLGGSFIVAANRGMLFSAQSESRFTLSQRAQRCQQSRPTADQFEAAK